MANPATMCVELKHRVLIAEDHERIAATYRLMLESLDYEVVLVNNGRDCIEIYNAFMRRISEKEGARGNAAVSLGAPPFDVVVLDFQLPLVDGVEVARHILSVAPSQRIVMASSYPRETISNSARILQRGVELMLKPFDLLDFADVVGGRRAPDVVGSESKPVHVECEQYNELALKNA